MKKWRLPLLLLIFSILVTPFSAQGQYDAHAAFAPFFYPHNGNTFRSANGSPGPDYWQNRADYRIHVKFDTTTKTITGTVRITYTNNSPDKLPFVWLYLDQNIDRKGSRAAGMQPAGPAGTEAGFNIHQVAVIEKGKPAAVPYLVDGTRMQVRLPESIEAKGGKLQLEISFSYPLLRSGGGGRSGYLDTRYGRVYEVSYWYPRMCVYDDLLGWNTLPFLGSGEFYMEYGDMDYSVTLPAGMIVAGSGELKNPGQVLTRLETDRMTRARHADQAVIIRQAAEPATQPGSSGQLTWHFHMDSTRDVAWAASTAFVWDAARINLPGGKKALAMSVYPAESGSDSLWGRATEYLKSSVETFSNSWFPYPYPVAINVGGPVGGMEFPGITFDWWKAGGKGLFALLSHEIGHNWYPMIVGSDERRHAWMDEGFNTFIDIYAQQQFNHGEYAPKRDGEYAPHGGNPAEEIVPFITRPGIDPIVSLADALPTKDVHPLEYFKTAFGLVLLREVILGHDRFDYAFRQYTRDWAYKHPAPWDFFREMENGAGEDLSWFWRGWFLQDWKLDQEVEQVKYVDNDAKKGAVITIRNLGKMPMPALISVTDSKDTVQQIRLPVEIWERGDTWTFRVNTTTPLKSVTLDPAKLLPDVDRSNNTWKAN